MTRIIYRSLLGLHPKVFRRRFGAEMMCIFDEVAADGATAPLIVDALASLLRQWLLRSGAWIAIAALLGAFIQVSVGGFSFFLFTRGTSARVPNATEAISPAAAELIQLMLWTSGSLVVIVLLTTLWIRNFTRGIDGH